MKAEEPPLYLLHRQSRFSEPEIKKIKKKPPGSAPEGIDDTYTN
jgi:hypothetical protein